MTKRIFWLVLGFGLGVGLAVRVNRSVRRTLERYVPRAVIERLRSLDAALVARAALIRSRRVGG